MSEDVAEFWLTEPKYIKQAGDAYEQYVAASPVVPVKIVLPAQVLRKVTDKSTGKVSEVLVDQPESSFMRRIKPEKLKPAHAVIKQELVRKSHEAKAASESRAADK